MKNALLATLAATLLTFGLIGARCAPEAACESEVDCFVICNCGGASRTASHACTAGFCAPGYLEAADCSSLCGGRGGAGVDDDDDVGDDDSSGDDDDSAPLGG
jgi:hypothetical protein